MLRHIAWFNEPPVEPLPEGGGLTSPDPIVRRRALIPARELENLGVECSVFGNLHNADPLHVSRHLQKLDTDIVVIGKISDPSRLKLARAAKHLGCYVIADIGNNEEASPEIASLADVTDQFVAATPALAASIQAQTKLPVIVIPDCNEDQGEPSASAIAELWMGCFKKLKLKPPASANTNTPQRT